MNEPLSLGGLFCILYSVKKGDLCEFVYTVRINQIHKIGPEFFLEKLDLSVF